MFKCQICNDENCWGHTNDEKSALESAEAERRKTVQLQILYDQMKITAEVEREKNAKLEAALNEKRTLPSSVWIHRFTDEGKRRTAVSWDGQISTAYREYVPAEELARLREALEKIIARSHSWVITRETGAIQKPIHDEYREIAKAALSDSDKCICGDINSRNCPIHQGKK
jgi:hypothetical protein